MSLARLLSGDARLLAPPPLPALGRLLSAARRIEERWPDIGFAGEKDRDALVAEMKRRMEQDHWEGARVSLAVAAGRALFDLDRRHRTDLAALRTFYYDEIAVSDRRALLSGMFQAYLDSYEPGAEHTRLLARALSMSRDRLGSRPRRLISSIPDILDPDRAHDAIASVMAGADQPYEAMRELGVRAPHDPGLMDYAHTGFVARLAPDLSQPAAVARLLAWLAPPGREARMAGASPAIAALLRPWLHQEPPEAFRRKLIGELVGFYGDPRLNPGGAWHGVPQPEMTIMMRWLTGENIRLLFDVVSKTNPSHMWPERKKFYLDLHRQGRITAAWVAFDAAGAREARRQMAEAGERDRLAFGRQIAGGTRSGTSLLILQFGSRILVEGSHNYKVHIFKPDDPHAPRLYERSYDCERIRLSPRVAAKPHLGNWQGWVLERI